MLEYRRKTLKRTKKHWKTTAICHSRARVVVAWGTASTSVSSMTRDCSQLHIRKQFSPLHGWDRKRKFLCMLYLRKITQATCWCVPEVLIFSAIWSSNNHCQVHLCYSRWHTWSHWGWYGGTYTMGEEIAQVRCWEFIRQKKSSTIGWKGRVLHIYISLQKHFIFLHLLNIKNVCQIVTKECKSCAFRLRMTLSRKKHEAEINVPFNSICVMQEISQTVIIRMLRFYGRQQGAFF